MAPGYMNVRITTDLHNAADLNIIISKSIISMTFTMSYAQWSEVPSEIKFKSLDFSRGQTVKTKTKTLSFKTKTLLFKTKTKTIF
jgi:hypothetical protein